MQNHVSYGIMLKATPSQNDQQEGDEGLDLVKKRGAMLRIRLNFFSV